MKKIRKKVRTYIDTNVYDEAIKRINHIYDIFDTVVVLFSGGKDSLATLHLVKEVADSRGIKKVDVVFHFGDKLVNLKDVSHCVLDEWVNSLGVPFELIDTFREREVHLFDSIGKKWFLNWKESRENAIVSVSNDLKVTSLLSVGIYFLVK